MSKLEQISCGACPTCGSLVQLIDENGALKCRKLPRKDIHESEIAYERKSRVDAVTSAEAEINRLSNCIAEIEARAEKAEAELAYWKDCNLYPSTYRDAVEANAALRDALVNLVAWAEGAEEQMECERGSMRSAKRMAEDGDLAAEIIATKAILEQTKEAEDG